VNNLNKSFDGTPVLRDINLDVDRGEVFAFIGSSGSGKTTLLRLAHLLDSPTSGKIRFDGADTDASESARLAMRRRMAMVFQRPVAFQASVFDNVAYGLNIRGIKGVERERRIRRALETVELSGFEKRNAQSLSGGELQRVALARAMVTEPEVLFLDEPTANLDPVNTQRVEELLGRVIKELKTTVVMATHDMAQGQRLANRIAVLLNGELLQTGTPYEVFNAPRNRAIADFVGVENVFEGAVVSNEEGILGIDIGKGVVHAYGKYEVGDRVQAFIRPEEVVLALQPMSTSARNVYMGRVTHVVRQGALARVTLDCGFTLKALVTTRSAEDLGLVEGSQVCAFFKVTGMHVVPQGR
jgi:tungstate transport system ATP-binding protein